MCFVFISLGPLRRPSRILPDQKRHLHYVVILLTFIFRLVTADTKARTVPSLYMPSKFPESIVVKLAADTARHFLDLHSACRKWQSRPMPSR
jgi:hypothetical protein